GRELLGGIGAKLVGEQVQQLGRQRDHCVGVVSLILELAEDRLRQDLDRLLALRAGIMSAALDRLGHIGHPSLSFPPAPCASPMPGYGTVAKSRNSKRISAVQPSFREVMYALSRRGVRIVIRTHLRV